MKHLKDTYTREQYGARAVCGSVLARILNKYTKLADSSCKKGQNSIPGGHQKI